MREEVGGYVYVLASARGVTRLVWFEAHESVAAAYGREKSIKRWRREWKLALIEKANPQWRDLYDEVTSNLLPVTFLNDASRTQPRP